MTRAETWTAILHSPDFWQQWLRPMRPLDDAQQEMMIKVLAKQSRVPSSRVRERMTAYLRGRVAEYRGEIHPGTNTAQ
jgi:hypothetical protein